MEFVLADAESLPKYLYEALGRYRYRVFVERLGWRLDTPPGIERDQFDRPDTGGPGGGIEVVGHPPFEQ